MAPQPSSGTYGFNPGLSDLVIEAYSRIQIRPTQFTAQHMFDARMSANLLLTEFSVREGPNLWEIELLSIPLTQGVTSYAVPRNVVAIYDYYIRQFQFDGVVNLTPTFSTVMNSTLVTINYPNFGLVPGNWVNILVPVAIGGIVVQGFYSITAVLDVNNFQITVPSNAISTATATGIVPLFTTVASSASVLVTLVNHGLYAGQTFTVNVSTSVGGLSLNGVYEVATVIDANNFTITSPFIAGSGATAFENGGQTQVAPQSNANPIDRVILPISRTEYADQPNKFNQAFPTSVWWDRLINSQLTLWPVPDQNGPYVLMCYCQTQIQDAVIQNGASMDLPYRFLEAFASGLAARLAIKYPPPPPNSSIIMNQLYEQAWNFAANQDTEAGPLMLVPGLSSYFR